MPIGQVQRDIMSGHVRFALTAHEQINLIKTHMDARLDLPSGHTGSDLPPQYEHCDFDWLSLWARTF